MQQTRASENGTSLMPAAPVRVLVISQHEAVRRQLVTYLGRSTALAVTGNEFSPEIIERSRPDVLVLDLSRLGASQLQEALDEIRHVGGRVIALASIREPADERAVTDVGGLYRLKSAGADGLADVVQAAAGRESVAAAS